MNLTIAILCAVLAVLVLIDRKQTLAFLPLGVPEANPFAAWVMEHFRTDTEGYLPGARIWFAGAFAVLGLLTALALLLPKPWPLIPVCILALFWLPLQIACVWSNWKSHDKWFKTDSEGPP